ncbi:MAG: exodeoxyribonuclease VII small subunit [Bacillota bacterium]
MSDPQQSPPTLEEALCELEQIISAIEAGQLSLEENLTHYERGRFLVQHCHHMLNQAQRRIDESAHADLTIDTPPGIEQES